jgi:hypothetical protein
MSLHGNLRHGVLRARGPLQDFNVNVEGDARRAEEEL